MGSVTDGTYTFPTYVRVYAEIDSLFFSNLHLSITESKTKLDNAASTFS